jgi:hypothetical protein
MSKPIYRAYKPVTETDGITSWIKHWFDPSEVMTPDDKAMRRSILMACAPEARIAAMQENLDSLQNPTSLINLNADEIRKIHAGISNHSHVNGKDFDALRKADELWAHIVILRDMRPKAIWGDSHSKNQSKKAKLPRSIITGIKKKLSREHPNSQAKELWPHLYYKLEDMGLDPARNDDVPGKEWYTYVHNDKRKSIAFRTFKNIKINK